MSEIIEIAYMIRARVKRNTLARGEKSEVCYKATDAQSGGYPYWTPFLSSADKYTTAGKAADVLEQDLHYLQNGVVGTPEVIEVTTTATVIDNVDLADRLVKERRESGLAKLTESERLALGL
jgi:hypothetical protein